MTRSPRSSAASRRGARARAAVVAAGALLLALAASGCARGPTDAPGVVRTDSAGVRIVTSGAEDRELPWRLERLDVMRDSAGEPWLFERLPKEWVLTDRGGRTYVVTRDPAIVRFGRGGRYERTIGRQGSGPGEYQIPMMLGAQGDTLFVRDLARRTLVRFGPDLLPTTEFRLEGALAQARFVAFRSGGLWYGANLEDDSTESQAIYADTTSGVPLQRVSSRIGAPVDLGCIGLPRPTPLFSPALLFSTAGPRILLNAQPGYELWLYEGARAVASVRRPLPPRAPTLADVRARYPQGMTIGIPGRPTCRVSVEDLMAKQGVAARLPFIFDLQYLSDGTIWVKRSVDLAPEHVLDVFGPDGAYAGTLRGMRLPVGLLPNGELLVPVDDADSGGLHLARYRITR